MPIPLELVPGRLLTHRHVGPSGRLQRHIPALHRHPFRLTGISGGFSRPNLGRGRLDNLARSRLQLRLTRYRIEIADVRFWINAHRTIDQASALVPRARTSLSRSQM